MEISNQNIERLINTPSLEAELHMIRHFKNISEDLKAKLVENGTPLLQIDNFLTVPGSRFFSNFASDITELLSVAFLYTFSSQVGGNGNIELTFNIPESIFPDGIGTKSVVHISDIPIAQQSQIYTDKNRGVPLQHLKVNILPITNEFVIILKPSGGRYIFITAFPGISAMPVPDHRMEKEFFDTCKLFWDKHVFLVQT